MSNDSGSDPATPPVARRIEAPPGAVWAVLADGWLYATWVVGASRVRDVFPDAGEPVPIRARVQVSGEVADLPRKADGSPAAPIPVVAWATAETAPPGGSWTGMPATASGGGYAGPLAYRQGEGMRPDVATAFDQIAAAARKAGIGLTISSAFRSDAEQAVLFARHPDPTWVAPPGHSLHRCATELDLGPPSAHGWLYAHANSFGFLKRYSWEPWHYEARLRCFAILRQRYSFAPEAFTRRAGDEATALSKRSHGPSVGRPACSSVRCGRLPVGL